MENEVWVDMTECGSLEVRRRRNTFQEINMMFEVVQASSGKGCGVCGTFPGSVVDKQRLSLCLLMVECWIVDFAYQCVPSHDAIYTIAAHWIATGSAHVSWYAGLQLGSTAI